MRTSTILAIFALTAATSVSAAKTRKGGAPPRRVAPKGGSHKPAGVRKATPRKSGAQKPKPKFTLGRLVSHVTAAAGAAEAVGNAVQAFKNPGAAAAALRRELHDADELYARELYDEVYARELEEQYYARGVEDEEVFAREFLEDALEAREYDYAHWARGVEDEEVFAREFLEDALEAREYDDAHWARGDFEELFARANEAADELD